MTLEEFDEALLTHGARLALWPAAQRDAATALLAENAEARLLLDEATALTGQLHAALAPTTADSVVVARLQAALHQRQNTQSLLAILPMRRLAALASAAGLGGIVAGLLAPAGGQVAVLLLMAMGGVTP